MVEQTSAKVQTWDRKRGESEDAWKAFQMYRDMGPARSLQSIEGYALAMLRDWHKAWSWKKRVESFDGWVSEVRRAELATLIAEDEKNAYQERRALRAKLRGVLLLEVDRHLKELQATNMSTMKLPDFIRAVDTLERLELLEEGKPTEIVGQAQSKLAELTDEDLAEAKRMALEKRAAMDADKTSSN